MNYLSVKPLVLSSTLSHIWDRLNLPMLLFQIQIFKILTAICHIKVIFHT